MNRRSECWNMCRQDKTGPSLASVLDPVSWDMDTMRAHLAATVRDTSDVLIRQIVDFLLETPGKQLRPALVLLSARAVAARSNGAGPIPRAAVEMAAAVEMIHMASLIHDDLIDGAVLRHHRPSVHARWGKRIAVMVGDFLFAKAFQRVSECADPRLFAGLGTPLCEMCRGEIQQVADRGDFRISESSCLVTVEKKTAALFSACCHAGSVIAHGKPGTCRVLEEFGHHFGIAFQILDDCRDLVSDQEGLGKRPGQDLQAGDVTLPLLYAIGYGGREGTRTTPRNVAALRDLEAARAGAVFRSSPAPARMAELIAAHVGEAQRAIRPLVDSPFKGSLHGLADLLAESAGRMLEG